MAPALLTAVDSASHIHLIVGSNPLAGARCTRSIEVGANPILIAPEDATLHYGLVKRIEEGEVKWLKRSFREEDLSTLGRPEVDGVVDAVFVTAGGKQGQSTFVTCSCLEPYLTEFRHTNIQPLPPVTNPRQRCRCPQPLLLHTPLHTLGRPSPDWCNNVWQGLQAISSHTAGDCIFVAPTPG